MIYQSVTQLNSGLGTYLYQPLCLHLLDQTYPILTNLCYMFLSIDYGILTYYPRIKLVHYNIGIINHK